MSKDNTSIRLRMHHIGQVVSMVVNEDARAVGLIYASQSKKFGPEGVEEYRKFIDSISNETLIKIVPSLDDICNLCRLPIEERKKSCYEVDGGNWAIPGIKVGEIYTFKNIKELFKKYVECDGILSPEAHD